MVTTITEEIIAQIKCIADEGRRAMRGLWGRIAKEKSQCCGVVCFEYYAALATDGY